MYWVFKHGIILQAARVLLKKNGWIQIRISLFPKENFLNKILLGKMFRRRKKSSPGEDSHHTGQAKLARGPERSQLVGGCLSARTCRPLQCRISKYNRNQCALKKENSAYRAHSSLHKGVVVPNCTGAELHNSGGAHATTPQASSGRKTKWWQKRH